MSRTHRRTLARSSLLAATAIVTAAAWSAEAASITDSDALVTAIEQWMTEVSANWAGELSTAGPVAASGADGNYQVTLPGFRVDMPVDSGGLAASLAIEFGDVLMALTPDPVDDALTGFKISLAPGVIAILTGGEPSAEIAIGEQRVRGVWSSEIETTTDYDMTWSGVDIYPVGAAEGDGMVSIATLHAVADMIESQPGLWDGEMAVAVKDLIAEADGEVPVRIGEMQISETFGGVDFAAYNAFVNEIGVTFGEPLAFESDAEGMAFFKRLILDMPTLADEFSFAYAIAGMEVTDGGETMYIDNLTTKFGVSGLAGDLASAEFTLSGAGVDVPGGELPPVFTPTVVDIKVTAQDIPTGDAWAALEDAMAGDIANPDMIGAIVGQQVVDYALQAGTSLNYEGHLAWPDWRVDFEGYAQADANAVNMASGWLTVTVTDMQQMITEIDAMYGPQSSGPAVMVQQMGQQQTADDGSALTVYEFNFQPSGDVLLNGQDVGPMLEAMHL